MVGVEIQDRYDWFVMNSSNMEEPNVELWYLESDRVLEMPEWYRF